MPEEGKLYARLVESVQEGILLANPSFEITFVNSRMAKMFGVEISALLNKSFFHLDGLKLLPATTYGFCSGLAEGCEHYDMEITRPDGSKVFGHACIAPFLDEWETFECVIICVQDITHLKQATQVLEESEKRFRNLFDSMITGFALHEIILDEHGTPCDYLFLSVNPAFERLTGLKAEDLVGRRVLEVLPQLEACWIENYGRVALTGEPIRFEQYSRALGKHYEVAAYSPAPRQFATVFQDVTVRNKMDIALRESEKKVRAKLDAILLPEGDIGALNLADIVDMEAVQALMNEFHKLTQIGVAIVDMQGTVLVATGWQDICTQFHRVHPETRKNCIESDTILSSDIEPGTFNMYRCKNGMWDIATPLVIGGKHLGNLFLGQFFFTDEEPDEETFRAQARRYGFDEKDYLAALGRVPCWSRETVRTVTSFYSRLADMISTLSYSNVKLARTLTERERVEKALRESEQFIEEIAAHVPGVLYQLVGRSLKDVQVTFFSTQGQTIFSVPADLREEETFTWFLQHVAEEDRAPFLASVEEAVVNGRAWFFEGRFVKPSGDLIWFSGQSYPLQKNGQIIHNGILEDITARKKAEEERRKLTSQLRELARHLQSAREDESGRIAARIHDEVGQALTAVRMDISILEGELTDVQGEAEGTIKGIKRTLDDAVKTVQNISMELRPSILDDLGLTAALEWAVREAEKRMQIPVRLEVGNVPEELPPELATAFFRIAKEGVTNIARHANATEVAVDLSCKDGFLILKITDNGQGMEKDRLNDPSSFGFIQMRERILALDGTLLVESEKGKGTMVTAAAKI